MTLISRQRGIISLSQLIIVMSISMLITAASLWVQARSLRVQQGKAQADALVVLTNAYATYATDYFTPLVKGTTVSGVANAYAPTIPELQSLGLLTLAFSQTNFYNTGYQALISLYPATCTPPSCDLTILVNLTGPITDPMTHNVDGGILGQALLEAGGNAGYSDLINPGTIEGTNGSWSAVNPVVSGGKPVAGILAMRAGYGASGWAQFTRRDGTQPPTADWNMAGYSVTGINNLGSTTLNNTGAAAIGGAATVGGTLAVTGQTTTSGLTNNGSLQNNGAATITGMTSTQGITNSGNITNSGDVITGRLWLQTIEVNGAYCAQNGYQAATAAGSIVSCINNTWTTPNANTAVPAPCSSQNVSWGSGCNGTAYSTTSGNEVYVGTSYGSGYAYFTCNNGSWSYAFGSCTPPPSPCSGTYSWGGGICSASYNMSSGGQQALNYSGAGPQGGSYIGSATLSCTNGNYSVQGTPSCTYTTNGAAPTVFNSEIPSQTDLQLASNPTSAQSYCSAVLPGSTASYTDVAQPPSSGLWSCWNNNGYDCDIPPDGSNCGAANGCSCWNYEQDHGPYSCFTITSITCTRSGS